jgi:hypothetical protein
LGQNRQKLVTTNIYADFICNERKSIHAKVVSK